MLQIQKNTNIDTFIKYKHTQFYISNMCKTIVELFCLAKFVFVLKEEFQLEIRVQRVLNPYNSKTVIMKNKTTIKGLPIFY